MTISKTIKQGRMPTRSPVVLPAVFLVIIASIFIVGCGSDNVASTAEPTVVTDTKVSQDAAALPIWRYVNSGWVTPLSEQSADAFSRDLRAAVITSDLEMLEFNREVVSKRTNGTSTSLSRPEFPGSVVLVAYLLWLPVQGDPLSVVGIEIDGNRAVVELELDDDAQGRQLPYLYAPMTMVTVDRSEFPADGPVDFEFRLDGDTFATVTDDLR